MSTVMRIDIRIITVTFCKIHAAPFIGDEFRMRAATLGTLSATRKVGDNQHSTQ